ncbi:ABC transporter permease [Nonomuraea jiangxiensis]|uniref:FtsX-like permease family protein n=1 Tax=Nonomuraea jiangxiensis TaxID=633440 RepID=A0A1G7YFN6_9ACTN|nr:ABC transporter permease [Nonomuraea jiangxiensis]SDG95174.1 FtsX-like permease family protein [Nonomuraea jiangxiensis]
MRGPLIVKRAFSEPLLLLAAFGSILLATTTLVALTMYASSIADAGVRRTMETASYQQTTATVSAPVTVETFPGFDRSVRAEFARAYTRPPAVTTSFGSDSYTMPGQERRKRPELLRFGSYDGLDRHARLVSGAWPRAGGDRVEVAMSLSAASASGFQVGQEFTTTGRLDPRPVQVRVAGIFQLDDPFGERWAGEPLLSRGTERGEFTTYGPLMVARETFVTHFATSVNATWTAEPDLRALTPAQLRPMAAAIDRVEKRLKAGGCANCVAASRLPEMLTQLDTASLVARSTMLIPVLQLLLLAAYALMLTARLLADHRRMEVALLRSRGAGTVRLAGLAGGEALLVALPCAVVAPFLGPPLLALVNQLPWIKASGVRLAPVADLGSFLVSFGVALAAVVLLVLPALAGARRTYVEEQTARGRSGGRGLIQRAGADLALLVVAALAIWQLRHYGAPVTATAAGGLGIDPLIISGPALALLTGGMLGLRLVPRISKPAEKLTSRRPTLAPALGAWQVSRRPLKYAGPTLLLTMAVAIGIVSLATAATWRASQDDQARHQAGADLRLSGPPDGPELGSLGRGTAFTTLPGVTAASPAFRGQTELSGESAVLLGVEAGKLGELFRLRPDLSAQTVEQMSRALAGSQAGRLELPGRPATLTLRARVDADLPLRLVLSDGLGVWRDLPLGVLHAGDNRIDLDLRPLAGRTGKITYPLSLRGLIAITAPGPANLTLTGLSAGGRELAAPPLSMKVTGTSPAMAAFAPPPAPGPVPVVLTADLAASIKLGVGQVGPAGIDRKVLQVKVVAVVDTMPTTTAGQPAVLADWGTLQAYELSVAELPRPATEWWLAADDPTPAVRALASRPEWDVTALDERALAATLRDDPLASGLQGALMLGFLAALVFAALGFLVNAAVAARERTAEFAILRALGVSSRQMFGLLAIEQAFVIGLSLAAGTGLALVVGVLVVPHIVLTGQATAVSPGVLLDIPWGATAAMLALVAAVLFAIVAGLARNLRRQGLGLREEQ